MLDPCRRLPRRFPEMLVRPLLPCLLLLSATPVWGQFSGLVGRIPKDANTAVFVQADKLFASPIAQRQRWQQRREAAFEAGVSGLPPKASEVVLAARVDFEFGRSVWELTLMQHPGAVGVSELAQRFGGTVDRIEEKDAVKLPNDQYVVALTKGVFASYTPSNRQDVARWLRSTDVTDPSRSFRDYLSTAYAYATKVGTPLIMAMDLRDVLSPQEIEGRLARLSALSSASKADREQAAKLISALEGITLGVTFTDTLNGAIRVDFTESPDALATVAKPLLIEILENHGSMLEDIRDWQGRVEGNTWLLSGLMSESGLRRVLSFLAMPESLAAAMDEAKIALESSPESAMRVASQQYYLSLNSLLKDLREKPKRDGVQTFGQAAIWYQRYAGKIDSLPILNVDPRLVDFGAQTAELLRTAERNMKGVGMRSVAQTTGSNAAGGFAGGSFGGYRGYYNGFGPGQTAMMAANANAARGAVQAEQQADTIIRTRERIGGAASVQQIWSVIDQASADLRREMTVKYQVEF